MCRRKGNRKMIGNRCKGKKKGEKGETGECVLVGKKGGRLGKKLSVMEQARGD